MDEIVSFAHVCCSWLRLCFCSSLSGPLPSALPLSLTQLSLNHNGFSGPLPEWDAPSLAYLNLANLPLNTSIPDGWWERMPALTIVDLSECGLSGPIPGALSPCSFSRFILSDNQLTGGLPANITAVFFDVSHNALSGPVWLPQVRNDPEMVVNLAQNNLSCPIQLAHLTKLRRLNLQSGGFAGCDFSDAEQVQLPESLATLDVSSTRTTRSHLRFGNMQPHPSPLSPIAHAHAPPLCAASFAQISDNAWSPFSLLIPPGLVTLRARNASIVGVASSVTDSKLASVVLDDNALVPHEQALSIMVLARREELRVLSCNRCGLKFDLQSLVGFFFKTQLLQELHFAQVGAHTCARASGGLRMRRCAAGGGASLTPLVID